MFETSRPQQTPRGRLLFYETLPVSIFLHVLVIGAVFLGTVWKVEFPHESPKLYMAFHLADAPPPPPPPPPPPAAKPQPSTPKVVKVPDEIVAPTVIPDEIPVVEAEFVQQIDPPGAVEGGVEGGIEGGEIGGIVGGVIGGVVTPQPQEPETPKPIDDGRLHIPRDEPLSLGVLSQVYPTYPYDAVTRGWEDSLVVRYVIGTNGRVREVTIVSPPQRKEFEQPTIRAIRLWRFRPFVKAGKKMEVVHELTVNYKLVVGG